MNKLKEVEEYIVKLVNRLRPRLTSVYTFEKTMNKKVDAEKLKFIHEVEDSMGDDIGNLINNDSDEKESEQDLFYKLVTQEQDDIYTQFYNEKQGKKKKIPDKIFETVGTFLFNRGIIATSSTVIQRRQPREIREAVQAAMYIKSYEDGWVKSIVENMRRFIQGRGIKFDCQVPEVQEILESFWKLNKMPVREKQFMHNTIAESEGFPLYFISGETGDVKIRQVSPSEITAVETDPEDIETILSYTREFFKSELNEDDPNLPFKSEMEKKIYPDIDYFMQKKGSFSVISRHEEDKEWQGSDELTLMQFVKLGKNREVRSRVMLQPILKQIRIYTNWLADRAVLNHERARVVWILTLKGKLAETRKRNKIAPSSGVTRIETEGRTWRVENAKIQGDDAKPDGRALLNAVAVSAEMPVSVFAQMVDDAVYASIKKADTPFTQLIIDAQDSWREVYKDMLRVVVRSKVKFGGLSKQFTVKKFLQEYHKKAFDIQHKRFNQKDISESEMLKTLQEVVRDFLSEVQFNHDFESSPSGGRQFTEQCVEFIDNVNENLIAVLESEDHKVNIKEQINKFMILYEKGVEVTVNAEDVPIEIVFPQIVKDDPLNQAKTLLILQKIGVSRTTLMRIAGYDPEREAAFREIEKIDGLFDDLDADLNTNNDRFNNDSNPPDLKKNKDAGGDSGINNEDDDKVDGGNK